MLLIIEDDVMCRRALKLLFGARGIQCEAVESAEQALELLATGTTPEMVLIDIDLPGMNGLDLLRVLQHVHPDIPCALMSANDHDVARRQTSQRVPFFPKPLDLRKLISHVGTAQTV